MWIKNTETGRAKREEREGERRRDRKYLCSKVIETIIAQVYKVEEEKKNVRIA